jgi:MFS family permease
MMDRKRSQVSIRKLVGLILLIVGQVFAVAAIQDVIAQALHILLSAESASVVMTSYMATVMLGSLFFGRLIDKVGEKRLLLWSLPLMAVTLCGYPFAQSTFSLTLVRVLHGISYALMVSAIFLVTRRSFSSKNQARASACVSTCMFLGSGLAMSVGLWVAKKTYLWEVVIALGISSVLFVYSGLALLAKPEQNFLKKERVLAHDVLTAYSIRRMMNKEALLLALPGVGVSSAYASFLGWIASYWGNQPGLILGMATAGNAVVALTFMPRLASNAKGYLPLMVGSNLIISFFVIWLGPPMPFMLLASILVGISICGANLGITEEISRKISYDQHGSAYATSGFMRQLGGVIGTAYSSLMWSYAGAAMWLTVIPLPLIALVILLLVKRKDRKKKAASKVILWHIAHKRRYVSMLAENGDDEIFQSGYKQLQRLLKEKGSSQIPSLDGVYTEEIAFFMRLKNLYRTMKLLLKLTQETLPLSIDDSMEKVTELLLQHLKEIEYHGMEEVYNSQMGHYHFWLSGVSVEKLHAGLVERAIKSAEVEAFTEKNILDLLQAIQILGFVDLQEVLEFYEKESQKTVNA